jgi:TIR domain
MTHQQAPFSESDFHAGQMARLGSSRHMPKFDGHWAQELVRQLQSLLPSRMLGLKPGHMSSTAGLSDVLNCFAQTPPEESKRLFHALLFTCETVAPLDEAATTWATELTVYATVQVMNWEYWNSLPSWQGDLDFQDASVMHVPTKSSLIAALGTSLMSGDFLRLNSDAAPRGVVDLSFISLGGDPVPVLLAALYDYVYRDEEPRANPDAPLQPDSPEVAKLSVEFDLKRTRNELAAVYLLLPRMDTAVRQDVANRVALALRAKVLPGDAQHEGKLVKARSQFSVATLLETVQRIFRLLPYFVPGDVSRLSLADAPVTPAVASASAPAVAAAVTIATPSEPSPSYTWDVFMSHASEDKAAFVDGLVNCLKAAGLKVWYDKGELAGGDSLVAGIEEGLRQSRFGVVVLSPRYFAKGWPKAELEALLARDNSDQSRRLLQVWLEISLAQVQEQSLMLASAIAFQADKGVLTVAEALRTVIKSRS